ncbi:ATP-binding protein [Amycolatopsis sp.]|uniref:ATP-binding protein n=1 Tax=Amycolatopsis sp. TaxID=37632 RepID=UPI002D81001A|nr:LuxR C-terminal-related transcriptional regulator [Amycolatopsis sp.]HET6708313.1 LuxR C-terminal-related transcriptional regulator [Amycolatopsis sp.]
MTVVASQAVSLPAPLSSFVGRTGELREIRSRLGTSRLLTLTGPGGVGKTRLALQVATSLVKAFPGGAWLVDLTPARDRPAVARAVAAALGLPERDAGSAPEQLTGLLAERRALLVLDNCEHLVDACAELAHVLLSAAPDLHVIATSRERLGLTGEHVFAVAPLPPDEAAELLQERTVAVRPGFRVTPANRAVVTRLCADLDGIPLAIELAASRLQTLTVEQVTDRLEDRFALLTGGSRVARPHQRTLRATIDWSWELCEPAERLLWNRLSVFAGTFALDAVECVCAGDGIAEYEVLDLLDRLVAQSVVVPAEIEGRPRYRLLETLWQYGRDRLAESGEKDRLRRRHRAFFIALARSIDERWFGHGQAEALARLRLEHPNLLAALDGDTDHPAKLELAVALRYHWYAGGFLGEGRQQLERALAAAPEPTLTRAKALFVAAWVALMQGDQAAADPWLDEADSVCEQAGASAECASVQATVRGFRGVAAQYRGQLDAALPHFEEAVAAFQALEDGREATGWLIALAQGQVYAGDPRAAETGTKAAAAAEGYGERWGRAHLLVALSFNAWARGETEAAKALARTGLECIRGFNDHVAVALMLEHLAWATAAGDQLRAARLLGAAGALWRDIGTDISAFHPHLAGFHQQCEEEIAGAVGPAAYATALSEGADRATTPAEAIALALGDHPAAEAAGATSMCALTRREHEVAALVARGLSNRQVASALGRSQRTVDRHVENILAKLGFRSRAQIAAWWVESQAPTP